MGGKRKREKQTRLAFNPIPSTSPSTEGYHQQIRDRAAAVGFEGSPLSKKRRDNDSSPFNHSSSANAPIDHTGNESCVAHYSESKRWSARQGKKRQVRIDFDRAREPSSFSPPRRLSPSSVLSPSSGRGMFSSQRQRQRESDSSSDEVEEVTQDEVASSTRKRKSSDRKSKRRQVQIAESDENGDEEDGEDEQIRSSLRTPGRHSKRPSQRPIVLSSDDEVSAANHRDSSEEIVSPLQNRASGRKSKAKAISVSPPRSRRKKRPIEQPTDDESEDGSHLPTSRRLKGRRAFTQEEQDDLDKDLRFLKPASDAEDMPRQPRSSQSTKKNARLEALAQLKRKRAGQPEPVEILGRPDHEILSDDDDDEENELDVGADAFDEQMIPTSSRQIFQETEEDQDFIIEEDEELGIPEHVPIEFTQFARMKAKDLFKYAVDWMVQKKINPAFERNDELYQLTFRKLDDEVQGLAGSKFRSSAWTTQFTFALRARPTIEYEHFDANSSEGWLHDKCDACNRSKHPASYTVRFQGRPYHTETLEDVASANDESDSDASTSDDSQTHDSATNVIRDAQGNVIDPEDTVYFVGRTCMANCQTAHALQHWRYHLYDWVTTWLIRHGYDTADKVLERDKMSVRKRRKQANKIVDRMEREGVIKTLWHEFKKNIDDARNAKQGGRFPGMDSP